MVIKNVANLIKREGIVPKRLDKAAEKWENKERAELVISRYMPR